LAIAFLRKINTVAEEIAVQGSDVCSKDFTARSGLSVPLRSIDSYAASSPVSSLS